MVANEDPIPGLELSVNGEKRQVSVPADTPLLWVIREELGLKGTKFGCGMGLCGACTVHLSGQAIRSCVTPVSAAVGEKVTTIEGLAGAAGQLHPVQEAWVAGNVSQCGYCQSGQIMSAAAFIAQNPQPGSEEIRSVMAGNICRCGSYQQIAQAVADAASRMKEGNKP